MCFTHAEFALSLLERPPRGRPTVPARRRVLSTAACREGVKATENAWVLGSAEKKEPCLILGSELGGPRSTFGPSSHCPDGNEAYSRSQGVWGRAGSPLSFSYSAVLSIIWDPRSSRAKKPERSSACSLGVQRGAVGLPVDPACLSPGNLEARGASRSPLPTPQRVFLL